ncbi:MAG TPA: outer membrane lipoprotein-sorting protein, partial [Treponemataceae bacterium]|nr:outer membrane lipoprotein-sorting protein [Treponemataceae bacterium]
MKNIQRIFLALLVCSLGINLTAQTNLSGKEILDRMDANQTFKTVSYSGTMTIDLGKRVLVKKMETVAEGSKKAFVEFLNPEDKGTRYLKLENEMWIYFPQEQDTVKISGHLLKEGMMGSDVSYEDALESGALADKYEIDVLGKEMLGDRPVWVLNLKAKVKTAPYDGQKLWIDSERYITLKAEMYAKSGKLLKESTVLEVKQFGSRWYPVKTLMKDTLRKGNGTLFEMTDLLFDSPVN